MVCSGAVLLPGLGVVDRTAVIDETTDFASSLVSLYTSVNTNQKVGNSERHTQWYLAQ